MNVAEQGGTNDPISALAQAFAGFVNPDMRRGRLPPHPRRPAPYAGALGAIPSQWDWRIHNTLPPVRFQGAHNTCTSFAITTAIEAAHFLAKKQRTVLAPGFIHTCLLGLPYNTGVWAGDALKAVSAGIAHGFLGDYPFPPNLCGTVPRVHIRDYEWISDEQTAMHAIANYGPVIAEMVIGKSFLHLPRDQVYRYTSDQAPMAHTLVLVGYDISQRYWIVQNAFSTSWSQSGFGFVAFGSGEMLTERPAFRVIL